MENNLNISYQIDDYLSGKMGESDKLSFENQINNNSLLKQELSFQRDIITSLKGARNLELKARLNAIDVAGVSTGAHVGWKIAAGLVIATGLFTASYLYFKNTTQVITSQPIAVDTAQKTIVSEKTITTEVEKRKETVSQIVSESTTSPEESTIINKKDKTPNPIVKKYSDVRFDVPVVPHTEQDLHTEANAASPNENLATENKQIKSAVEVALDHKSEFKFHYRYFNNKLYLLCDFGSKPYDLIELNRKKTRTLYLFFDKNYYELKDNQSDATALKIIKNNTIIKQLEVIRTNK